MDPGDKSRDDSPWCYGRAMNTAIVAALRADPAFAPLRRSLEVYYGDAARDAAMDALYARFLKPGELAFDIGSHVGDRIGSFRRLGARVVALEPQPLCARAIRAIYADDGDVTLVEAACGARAGQADAAHQLRQSDGLDRIGRFHLARPTVPAAGKARSGTARSRCRVQPSTRWLPSTARRRSPRSTWRASRTRCWPDCPGPCRRCPSSSPRSSATWPCGASIG